MCLSPGSPLALLGVNIVGMAINKYVQLDPEGCWSKGLHAVRFFLTVIVMIQLGTITCNNAVNRSNDRKWEHDWAKLVMQRPPLL